MISIDLKFAVKKSKISTGSWIFFSWLLYLFFSISRNFSQRFVWHVCLSIWITNCFILATFLWFWWNEWQSSSIWNYQFGGNLRDSIIYFIVSRSPLRLYWLIHCTFFSLRWSDGNFKITAITAMKAVNLQNRKNYNFNCLYGYELKHIFCISTNNKDNSITYMKILHF